ncbi:hypothetical protein ES703_94814 [subsurface metagenome]
MQEVTEKMLIEWKGSMENARHFNDLLIRFRMLGLPMVITLSVAGVAANQFVTSIELWKWTMPLITLSILISGLVALFLHTYRKLRYEKVTNKEEHEKKQEPPLSLSWFETFLWAIFVLIVSIITVIGFSNSASSNITTYSLTPIALIAAVTLLIALYAMDRFYYYKLLMGAVSRLVVLEKSLGFNITETTSKFMPRRHATNLITFFYCLPGIILMTISGISLNI